MIKTDSPADLAAFFKEGLDEEAQEHLNKRRRVFEILGVAALIALAVWVLCQRPEGRPIPIAIGVGNPTGDRGYGEDE